MMNLETVDGEREERERRKREERRRGVRPFMGKRKKTIKQFICSRHQQFRSEPKGPRQMYPPDVS
jgi:hypothetical protein